MSANLLGRYLTGLVGVAITALIATSASADKLKIGVLLPGPVTDNGYDADGGRAADALKSQLQADVQITENVSVANQADLYRQYAAKGYDIVIGWGGQFTDGAVQVAEEFPKVKFVVANSGIENGKNLGSFDIAVEQWQFVGGFVTAKLSKTNVIGWIGGACFPATAANLYGTEEGAKYANGSIKFLSTFVGDFDDPTKAQQAAQAMIDSKASALTGNLNSGYFGILKAAQQNGKLPVVTEWINNHSLAPDVIASSIQKSQARWVVAIVKDIIDGRFEGKHYQFALPKDWGPVMAKTDLMPQQIYDESLALQSKIVSGEIKPKRNENCPK